MFRHVFSLLIAVAVIVTIPSSGLAQDEDQEPLRDFVTITFELTVVGQPPPDATFFGYIGFEPFPVPLTDHNRDGVFTGSFDYFQRGDAQPFYIVQGTVTNPSQIFGEVPGEPSTVIADFGVLTIDQDTTLPANLAFEGAPGEETAQSLPTTGSLDPTLPGALILAAGGLF